MFDVCNFIPSEQVGGEIKFYHFVYENGVKKLRQPFLHSFYRMHLAVKSGGKLKICGKEYRLAPGTVFVTFPGIPYRIDAEDDFTYLYISFSGIGAENHFKELKVNPENCVFPGLEQLTDFWMSQIRRVGPANASRIAESILMHTLSFVGDCAEETPDKFESILRYMDSHYFEKDLSLKKIADIFFYSEKYLSALFKKKTDEKFTDYLNNLRIDAAVKHIKNGEDSVSGIADLCGFSDPYYFSRVFKKITGKAPTEYMKGLAE